MILPGKQKCLPGIYLPSVQALGKPVYCSANKTKEGEAEGGGDGEEGHQDGTESDGEAGKGCFHPLTLPSRR